MYIVRWDDHEGNEHEQPLPTLEDAKLEAADLAEDFDYVQILDENGNEVV